MKSPLFMPRAARSGHLHRASIRGRPKVRLEAHSFEALEERFLLSGLISGPIGSTSKVLPLPADVIFQLPAGPRSPQTVVGLPAGPFIARDDTYILDAGNGLPTVQVDLIWPEGSDPSDGYLLVSDDSGQILYDLPLAGVDGINAKLPIPSTSGSSSNLDVSLQISRPGQGTSTTGSYRISIDWDKSSTPASVPSVVSTPSVISSPSASAGASNLLGSAPLAFETPVDTTPLEPVAGPPAPQPMLTASRNLPPPLASPTPVVPTNPSGTAGGGPSVGALDVPGSARLVGIPVNATPGPSSSTASSPESSASFQVPLASAASGLGFSSIDEGGRPAVVGPLPLSGVTPDGGIFAYPNSQTKGLNDPFRATFTIAPAPDTLDGPDDLAGAPDPRRSGRARRPVPLDLPGFGPSIAHPFDFEILGEAAATGAAFLPSMGHLAESRTDRESKKSGASRWPVLHGRLKPRTSLVALLLGSAGLFVGLIAPDCVTRLTAWQDDRRWRRQLSLVASKPQADRAGEI